MASFITLAEAKAQLNSTSNVNDTELAVYIEAACDEVEQWVGPVATRVITGEFVDLMGRTIFNELTTAGTRAFVLRHRPVQSIQAISSAILSGVTYTPSDFIVDSATGIVRRGDGGTIFGPLTVDYTAGYVSPPAWAQLAARMIVQSLWSTQRGGTSRPSSGGGDPTVVPGYGVAVPAQAAQLMETHRLTPSVG
jgi:hypothetical protein